MNTDKHQDSWPINLPQSDFLICWVPRHIFDRHNPDFQVKVLIKFQTNFDIYNIQQLCRGAVALLVERPS